ncbi:MAG: hypothetical protein CMH54_13735 [Myxococcales bacterium]|nr:hypothetical protein [Myxococcales bacterium]|tara:strand:- start:1011 stop:1700 length:690 start_codon:yes stop_codon:yes gene_type:complete
MFVRRAAMFVSVLFALGCAEKSQKPAPNPNENQGAEPNTPTNPTNTTATPNKAAETQKVAAAGTAGGGCIYDKAIKTVDPNAKAEAHTCGTVAASAELTEGEETHFGDEFSSVTPVPVTDILADANSFHQKTVRVRGKIATVCKKKGCWFTVSAADGKGGTIRVSTNYKFFVPLDCDGKEVEVEGSFVNVPLSEAARKHLAEDAGEDPSKVSGEVTEPTIIATGAKIRG